MECGYIKRITKYISLFIILCFIIGSTSGAVFASSTVTAYGMNSCSNGWYHTGGTFENYCPFCHRYGTLEYNPKGTGEGEWTCSHCDSDFCLCGRCKATGSDVYLIKASTKPKVQTQIMTTVPELTKLDLLKIRINEPILKI